MPRWTLLLALAVVGWLVVAVGGGLALGWLLGAAERRRSPKPL